MPVPPWTSPRTRRTTRTNLFGSDDDPVDEPTADTLPIDDSDKAAVVVTSKRQVLPSSMGLSLLVPRPVVTLEVTVRWGDYHPEYARGRRRARARRANRLPSRPRPAVPSRRNSARSLPGRDEQREQPSPCPSTVTFDRPREQAVPNSDGLRLVWLSRPAPKEALDETLVPDGAQTVNVYLVNTREPTTGAAKDQSTAFQAELTVTCAEGFVPRPSLSGLNSSDDDDRVADLQYGNVYEFAVGHNVSAVARVDDANQCRTVRTAWVPKAQVERVEPAAMTGITLGMEKLAALSSPEDARAALIGLADQYEAWIAAQKRPARRPASCESRRDLRDLARQRRVAANRIRQGIEALSDPKVFRAFTLANAAMARQARRRDGLQKGVRPEQVDEPTWRPFQLAFFLLNLKGIVEPD